MMGRWAQRLWPLVIVGGLLAAVAVMSMLGKPGVDHIPLSRRNPIPHPSTAASASPTPHSTAFETSATVIKSHLPPWLADIAIYGCGLVIAVIVAWLVWFAIKLMFRNQALLHLTPGGGSSASRRDAVLAAVDDSIAELAREDTDARSAVIACWVRLEEVAAAAGTPRAPGETSSDLVAKLLGEHQVSRSLLLSLADLYRAARYSTQFIESAMREQARAALGRLRDELRYSRSGALAGEPVDKDVADVDAEAAPDNPPPIRRPRPSVRPEVKQ